MDRERLIERLKIHESVELKPYQDTKGIWTVGIGRNMSNGISVDEAEYMCSNDIDTAVSDAKLLFPDFDSFNSVRQEVITNMSFNMGYPTFSRFRNMRAAAADGDWDRTADEAKDSNWFTDVKGRAWELVWQLRHGEVGTPEEWESER